MAVTDIVVPLAVVAGIGLLGSLLIWLYRRHPVLRYYSVSARTARKRRVRLLYETDHHALLAACREVVAWVASEGRDPMDPGDLRHVPIDSCPPMIQNLHPETVYARPHRQVLVVMSDWPDSFGLRTWPQDYRHDPPVAQELVPGLWYYDDGYFKHPKHWDAWLAAVRPEPRRRGYAAIGRRIRKHMAFAFVDGISAVQRPLYCVLHFFYMGFGLVWGLCYLRKLARRQRVRLLYETDHQALLEACRELAGRLASGDLATKTYYFTAEPSPEISTFPQVLQDLRPSGITLCDNGAVLVAMTGGLDHCGVKVFPEMFVPKSGKELVPGLWYYDDGYDECPKTWEKRLRSLKPKRRRS